MAVSLAESKNNTQDMINVAVIDEFRKESAVLDTLIFDDVVNPAGGGATLTYGYRRQSTQADAAFRAINSEYTPSNVATTKHTVDLAVLGGAFEVDRVTAKLGPNDSSNVMLNLQNKIKATRTRFQDAVINGDIVDELTADAANGFDGLNKALKGSSTEFRPTTVTDWTDFDTDARAAYKALDLLDEFLGLLDGAPTVILGNAKALARVRAMARRSGLYTKDPIEGLVGANGRPINRESYGGIVFADAGEKAGSSNLIIPTVSRDMDGSKWLITVTGSPTGGTFTLTVNGVATSAIAYNAAAATVEAALEAVLVNTPNATVTGSAGGPWTATFDGTAYFAVALGTNSLTGGTTPSVTSVEQTTAATTGLTDLYAYRVGLDGFHGVSTIGGQIVQTWMPDFSSAGAVKKGEVELGPIGVALKKTKAAAVWRNIKVQ